MCLPSLARGRNSLLSHDQETVTASPITFKNFYIPDNPIIFNALNNLPDIELFQAQQSVFCPR